MTTQANGFIENIPIVNEKRPRVHIPMTDVDDLPFKTRQDPNFIASISNYY
jgi:hypothetical protein